MKLISVIMPVYNAENYLRKAIDSILNQTYQNIELLIADDASKDRTKTIIGSYSDIRIRTFHNENNLGYLKTCNQLFSKATGDYIAFQDADDYSDIHRLELQINAFSDNSELGVCGSNYIAIKDSGDEIFCSLFPLKFDEIMSYIPKNFYIHPNTFLFKKEVYETIGGYREYFDRIGCEDYDWLCLIAEKFPIITIKDALYYYRYSENSITRSFKSRRNLYSLELVKFLYNQRKETGTDALHSGNIKQIIDYEAELDKPFKNDPSFFYFTIAKKFFYEGAKKKALEFMKKAIIAKPYNLKYYRDFLFFLRKTI